MGQPKQLLPWGEQTLIEFQVKKLLKLGNPVYVVLGSSSDQILPLLSKYRVNVVLNTKWEDGMGTSVAAGIKQVLSDLPNSTAVIYTLIDQPLVSVAHLQKLIDSFTPGHEQIIASYSENGWLGVPALYDVVYSPELLSVKGKHGAKSIIKEYFHKVIRIKAGEELEDMDTPEKYRQMLERANSRI